MKHKALIFILFFVVLFLGEIAISFSFKKENDRNLPNSDIVPLSHKLSGYEFDDNSYHAIDSFVNKFMYQNKIVGASVAVAHKGKLVYAKGFGYASLEDTLSVQPEHLFRIASVSKLITAVTIMKLIEEEKLKLDSKVFGTDGILNDSLFLSYADKRVEKITIQQLLEHTSGWNNQKGDPVFNSLYVARKMNAPLPATPPTVIKYALSQKLDWSPGKNYSDSNLGYVILGEVIEKITGMEYEDYVQFAVLHPLGIYDMHIGRSYKEYRFRNEVTYYDLTHAPEIWSYDGSRKLVPIIYGGNPIELLGAAGGWVASAPELAKLMVAIDGFSSRPDFLSTQTIETMTYSAKRSRQLLGWRGSDGHGTWWRTGTFSGSTALLLRHHKDINFVILLNTGTYKESKIHNDISHTMFQAIHNIKTWPEYDLFNYEPGALSAQLPR